MPRRVNRGYPPQYPPFGGMPPAPGTESDEEEKIDPKAFYTHIDQIWDQYTFGNWQTRRLNTPDTSKSVNGRLIFKACNRVYGPFGPSTDDHTWIDLKSQPLVEFLRSEESLKGVEGLTQTPPGIDARDLFLRLPQLKKLAIEPTISLEDQISNTLSNTHIAPEENSGLGLTLSQGVKPEETEAQATLAPLKAPAVNGVTSEPEKPKTDDAKEPPAVTEPPLPAPEQLFILLKFIEDHFKDTADELERLKADGYMSFKLLWTLCVPGSIVETDDQATEYPMGVRVDSWGYGSDGKGFSMHGVKYAWNGKVFKQNQVSIETKRFKGLMDVNQIPMKILSSQSRARLIERGRLYQKFAGVNHLKYDAFITVSTQQGYVKRPAKGRVMVDATGFYRFNLNASGGPNGMGAYLYGNPPPLPMHHQQYPSPPTRKRFQIEEYKNDESLPEDILCLTPPAHLGWSFTAKTWGLILVENLSEIVFDELAFDQLVLRKEYKKMIKALVETHAGHGNGLAKDLVAGKGGGMVMVLHGKPGTGKTLTAEAISEHLKCPLYMVSSGELGIQAAQLEKHLNDILEMTSAWKAVVLIDEADVFLEARNTHDLARNSLVSVFLRLLEYHTGVLILTTNRIRSFDKAFVSRFSIALHYPDLDQTSRILIWKEFLTRAGVTVGDQKDTAPSKPTHIAYNDLVTLAKKSFNGRVIKQLVRGAQALAVAENEPLELSHILTVLGVTEQFEADWKELEFTEDIKGGGNQEASMYS